MTDRTHAAAFRRGNARRHERCATAAVLGLMVFAAGICAGDTMVVGTDTHRGTLEGYADKAFLFRTDQGKLLTQSRTPVLRVTVDAPRKATLERVGKHDAETVSFLGYERSRFMLEAGGAHEELVGMRVERLSITEVAEPMGGASSDTPQARPRIDVSALERRAELSGAQTSALSRYKTARADYDRFVAESTAMAGRLDALTGGRRVALLNELRMRKDDEQPLARELASAEAVLLAAFPELTAGGAQAAISPADRPASGAPGGPSEAPPVGRDEVLLIDTAALEALPELTAAQKAALQQYKAARIQFEHAEAPPGLVADQSEYDSAVRSMTAAQTALLQAFPGLQFGPAE